MPTRHLSLFLVILGFSGVVGATDIDREPIHYSSATPANRITRLEAKIKAGKAKLQFDGETGYLASFLRELEVPISSQTFVFSKTSLQRSKIKAKTPRAIYFNDDMYVGYCQRGDVLEISAVDPELGTVFYSLDNKEPAEPKFIRHGEACLICHGSSQNKGFPGHLVRSVYAEEDGSPVLAMGSHRIDQKSPLKVRWGGWYVTGESQDPHLGNLIIRHRGDPELFSKQAPQSVKELSKFFDTSHYLSGHSDIVALMVLEHQAEVHNLLTRANFQTRQAIYEQTELNKALGRWTGHRSELTTSRIWNACEPLLKFMLFAEEAPLAGPIVGSSAFTKEFPQQGPRDSKGRSLRDFDLKKRIFRYPLSYLIYSDSFDGLPEEAREYLLQRMYDILSEKDNGYYYNYLSANERREILEILRETKPNLPAYWRVSKSTN